MKPPVAELGESAAEDAVAGVDSGFARARTAAARAAPRPKGAPPAAPAPHGPKGPAPPPVGRGPVPVPTNPPPKGSPSFVMGGDGLSSPSNYTLEGNGSPGAAASGYSLEGDRGGGMGGLSMDTVPPTALRSSGPGVGSIFVFGLVGAAASFGILVAIQGVRAISKASMRLNDLTPNIEVDPETYEV